MGLAQVPRPRLPQHDPRSPPLPPPLPQLGSDLSGIILISSVLEFSTIRDNEGNDLPFALFLLSYAATAHHHKKIPTDKPLPTLLAEVEAFATGDYRQALARGATLPGSDRAAFAKKFAA